LGGDLLTRDEAFCVGAAQPTEARGFCVRPERSTASKAEDTHPMMRAISFSVGGCSGAMRNGTAISVIAAKAPQPWGGCTQRRTRVTGVLLPLVRNSSLTFTWEGSAAVRAEKLDLG
jgi:hypothetical protein